MNIARLVPSTRSADTSKIVSVAEAVRLIRNGDTMATGGFAGIGFAEEVVIALEQLYLANDAELATVGKPHDLALVFCAGQGNFATRGLSRRPTPAWSPASSAAISELRRSSPNWRYPGRSRPITCRRASSRTCCATSPPANPVICPESDSVPSSTRASAGGRSTIALPRT